LIFKMKPVPEEWIRRVLWDYLVVEKCTGLEMERIVAGVQAALAGLKGKKAPEEKWLRQVIEEARKEDPTEIVRRLLDKAIGGLGRTRKLLAKVLEIGEDVDGEALLDKVAELME